MRIEELKSRRNTLAELKKNDELVHRGQAKREKAVAGLFSAGLGRAPQPGVGRNNGGAALVFFSAVGSFFPGRFFFARI
jgi:hypothetical protein